MTTTRQKREQLKRLGWLTEAQAVLGWGVILILVALVGAIYLNQASRIASVGRRVQVDGGGLVGGTTGGCEALDAVGEPSGVDTDERVEDVLFTVHRGGRHPGAGAKRSVVRHLPSLSDATAVVG